MATRQMVRAGSRRLLRRAADVAFTSTASNLVTSAPLDGKTRQVFWRPVGAASARQLATILVSMGADGVSAGNGDSFNPVISPDGQFVAFVSLATNLVSNVTFDGVTPQVFVRSTCGGVSSTTCSPTTFLGFHAGWNHAWKWTKLGAVNLERGVCDRIRIHCAKSGRDGSKPKRTGRSVFAHVRDTGHNVHGRDGSRIHARWGNAGERREHANRDLRHERALHCLHFGRNQSRFQLGRNAGSIRARHLLQCRYDDLHTFDVPRFDA